MRREKEGLTNIELIQNGCVFYSPHRNVTERYVYIYASAEWNTLVTMIFSMPAMDEFKSGETLIRTFRVTFTR